MGSLEKVEGYKAPPKDESSPGEDLLAAIEAKDAAAVEVAMKVLIESCKGEEEV